MADIDLKAAAKGAAAMSAAVLAITAGLAAKWEGERRQTYFDLGSVPTICFGHTGPDVKPGLRKTAEECRVLLRADLEKHAAAIRPCVPASTPVESQAAFLDLAYNIGGRAFCSSTLARKLNAGDLRGACAELSRWIVVKGVRVQGLLNRRAEERRLCERGLANGR